MAANVPFTIFVLLQGEYSEPVCNLQVASQNIDCFLTENSKRFLLRIVVYYGIQFFLRQTDAFAISPTCTRAPWTEI